MRYSELSDWLNWLETLHPKEIDLGLDRVRQVAVNLELLNPEAKVITVAGTNGKGSCVATLRALLLEQGLKVGAYTSPHLIKYNERIALGSGFASDSEICDAFSKIDQARGNVSLTYFEFGTLAAILLFNAHQLDYWILEVGLGGRLDAVNILDADICVISSIDLDHEAWLGTSREQIALEKAGICRPNGLLVLSEADEPQSLSDFIEEQELTCFRIHKDFKLEARDKQLIYTSDKRSQSLPMDTMPELSLSSIAAALKVAELLNVLADTRALSKVVSGLKLAGRYQQERYGDYNLILDVAHNPAACRLLAVNLQRRGIRDIQAVVAVMRDKNIEALISPLLPMVKHWHCCELPGNFRASSAEEFAGILAKEGVKRKNITLSATPAGALESCTEYNYKNVLVFGSFFTVEQVVTFIEGEQLG